MEPTLRKLNSKFGMNVCGEGGEYETFTLDCPLFRKVQTNSTKMLYAAGCTFGDNLGLSFAKT